MYKSFKFILRTILFSFLPVFLHAQEVKITADFPESNRAGEEFLMSVRIEKGNLTGTSRIQMEVPFGFTAKKVITKSAEFSFDNNIIKYQWVEMPETDEFTVSYTLKADNKMRGKQIIKGEFIYSNGDKTEHVVMQPCVINITDEKTTSSKKTETPKVDRKIVSTSNKKGEYKVELTISPNNTEEQAQFTDVLPPDYSALVLDAHEGSFSFENQSVIFTWKKLPKENSFNISYLIRTTNPNAVEPIINGTLVYGDAAEISTPTVSQLSSKDNLIPTDEIEDSAPATETINSETPSETGMAIQTPEETTATEVTQETQNATPTPAEVLPVETTTNTANSGTPNTERPVAEQALAVANTPIASENSTISVSSTEILFKVQISATMHSTTKNSEWFERKFKIPPPVELTNDNGWKKYMIGSFSSYKDAKELKNQTREKISDAFIVAYLNGKRIPLSEAIRNKQLSQ